jgi:hypothetical protein
MDVYSGQSVLAFGQTLRIKMFIWCVYEACKATAEEHGDDNDTMKEAWRIMLWSLWFLNGLPSILGFRIFLWDHRMPLSRARG